MDKKIFSKNSLIIIFCGFHVFINAQVNFFGTSSGMANIKTVSNNDNSILFNPSSLVTNNSFIGGFQLSNMYSIKELNGACILLKYPLQNSSFGLYAANTGNNTYRSGTYGLSYGIKIAQDHSIGLRIKYAQANVLQSELYVPQHNVYSDIGVRLRINNKLILGSYIENIHLTDSSYALYPLSLSIGLSYSISKYVSGYVEFSKELYINPSIKIAIEYKPTEHIFIRGGALIYPANYTLGFGYKWNKWSLDISAQNHLILGNSYTTGIHYSVSK